MLADRHLLRRYYEGRMEGFRKGFVEGFLDSFGESLRQAIQETRYEAYRDFMQRLREVTPPDKLDETNRLIMEALMAMRKSAA